MVPRKKRTRHEIDVDGFSSFWGRDRELRSIQPLLTEPQHVIFIQRYRYHKFF